MEKLNEDYTAGVLAGIPVFCINRIYKVTTPTIKHKIQYIFEFDNGYGASVIEFKNRKWVNHHQYELAVLKNGNICYDSEITGEVESGNEYDMHKLLCRIEQLNTERIV